jgi:hypothetical protein
MALDANQQLFSSKLHSDLIKRKIKNYKVKVLNWAYSRRGKTRLIIRAAARMSRKIYLSLGISSFQKNRIWKATKHSLFKDTSNITSNVFRRIRLLQDLELLKAETEIIAPYGFQLSVIENESNLWISWPNALDNQNYLKSYPKLDSLLFPSAKGVWFTRSDYSEVCQPMNLKYLSWHFKKRKQEIIKLIYLATAPRFE